MTDTLTTICNTKREEVAARKAASTLADLAARAATQTGFALIAEIKKASPSKGLIRADFDPPAHAHAYEQGGATCLSVLTDAPYFQGHEDYLIAARAACNLPVLRKDFMVDPWQCAEARAIGADAILIIVAALDDGAMAEIEAAAREHGMDVLVEVHNEAEMERAARLQSRLIGVNNRDLKRFVTDLGTTARLAPLAPEGTFLVAESGISGHADVLHLAATGAQAFLVGESLMRHADVTAATRALLNG
jgi:indole-3-glycerol phosphate synthase